MVSTKLTSSKTEALPIVFATVVTIAVTLSLGTNILTKGFAKLHIQYQKRRHEQSHGPDGTVSHIFIHPGMYFVKDHTDVELGI